MQTGNGVWRVDMMKCPYHDTCTEYGCQELCRCFCDSDDISYTGLHPKLIWERSMTLGRGNDRCDFCMKVR
ncbi:L-2-amino-thiazoline-4-carboxylic acid hydrolase [Waltera sp.]|uniref:L-2-amino-thiazoline-4-carboxylic acid hydrolase n=1 Tax=Waltera sp. TaxID=2815806 RepID=UPI003990BDBD